VKKEIFDKLKKYKYEGVKLSEVASWAIWDPNCTENLEYIEQNIEKFKSNIVFVALNFGKKMPCWQNWQNFHGYGVGDRRLRELLSIKEFEGAYMTDLIKNFHNTDSPQAVKYFKENKKERNRDIYFFFEEIELLESKKIEMYLFGGAVEGLFKKYVMDYEKNEKYEKFKQKIIKCQRIYHFAMRGNNYVEKARVQLGFPQKGLTVRKYPTIKL